MQRLMQLKIEWHFSKSRLSATSIFAKASQNSLAWRCIGMAWKDYGDRIKVSYIAINLKSPSGLTRHFLTRKDIIWIFTVLSLQELACRAIVARTTVYGIDQLPLPKSIKSHLKSYAMTTTTQLRYNGNRSSSSSKSLGSHHRKLRFVGVGHNNGLSTPGSSPGSITDSRTSCVGRNSCTVSWKWKRGKKSG